jgi:hypothetical protein
MLAIHGTIRLLSCRRPLKSDLENLESMDTGPIHSRNRWILHFTHIDNVPMIARSGALVCDLQAGQGLMRAEVGDLEIKESRRRREIPVGPGGHVGDYVPFYYGSRTS